MHTGNDNMPWLQVDLVKQALIKNVKIYNRKDCCSERLTDAKIHAANSEDMIQDIQLCASFWKITTPSQIESFSCAPLVIGRYIRLTIQSVMMMNICEMQMMGIYKEN